MLALIATLAAMTTGVPCAAMDNTSNTAAFAVPGEASITRTYDDYGDSLGYDGPVPKPAWAASRAAEAALTVGPAGPKLRLACEVPTPE